MVNTGRGLGLRFLTDDDEVRAVWQLKNGRPAHVLTREEQARGGRLRAANARERRSSLGHAPRGSVRLIEAAERLGEMLRSENLESAMWADEVIKRHILPEASKHTSGATSAALDQLRAAVDGIAAGKGGTRTERT